MSAPNTANKQRLVLILALLGLLFALLLGRLFYVQVVWGPELQEKALLQWTMDSSLSADRGRILDRDGQTLAQSGTAYKVEINPQQISADSLLRVATELSNVLGMDYNYVLQRISDKGKQQIILKRQVEREQVDALMALKLGNGVTFGVDAKRYYPMGKLLSQTLGFTTVDGVGQEGLERSYNKYLSGEEGRLITETDNKNKPLAYGAQEFIPPVNGSSLVLTVDVVVQSILEKKLEEALQVNEAKSAQGIVMDVNTGEILAVSNKPDYNPNAPPRDNIEELLALVKNRVVSDAYEPGSTFKILTLASALDSGALQLTDEFDCRGTKDVNGEKIRCWKNGHGHQTLAEAVQNSCNPAFMTMALGMGIDTFYNYIYKFGFGSSTESGLVGESGGIIIHQKYIRPNNIARIGFGQSIAVTPMQLAGAVSAAVNGGNLMQPTIVKQILAEDGSVIKQNEPVVIRRVISEESSAVVRTLLEGVVANGSGRNAQIPGYRVGGKTGTAQKYVDGQVSSGSLIASFIGFAPADNPKYLVLILVDEPQVGVIFGSTVAAPFVKDVLQETLLHYGEKPEIETERVQIPNVIGISAEEAADLLQEAGLEATVTEGEDQALVKAQVPAAGEYAAKDSGVLLYTNETKADGESQNEDVLVEVPDILQKTRLQAYDALAAVGLELRIEPKDQTGVAVRQKPEAGTQVPFGESVLVDFSPISGG